MDFGFVSAILYLLRGASFFDYMLEELSGHIKYVPPLYLGLIAWTTNYVLTSGKDAVPMDNTTKQLVASVFVMLSIGLVTSVVSYVCVVLAKSARSYNDATADTAVKQIQSATAIRLTDVAIWSFFFCAICGVSIILPFGAILWHLLFG